MLCYLPTDEIYANRYNYDYNNNYLCLYTTGTIKNKCALLRNVCEQEKLLVNMKLCYLYFGIYLKNCARVQNMKVSDLTEPVQVST
jgi:hypothetical protein